MISIVIPLYNKKSYIEQTLASVVAQTYKDFEIIVVDDGSTDGGAEVVKRIYDARIRLVHQTNAGVSAARNRGIQEAKSDWIAFLDADDTWHAEKLQKQMYWIEEYPDIMWASCGFSWARVSGQVRHVDKFRGSWFQDACLLKDGLVPLSCGRHFWTGTVMVHRKVFQTVQPFDVSLRTGEDIDFFYRMACHFPQLVYLPECLAYYHIGVPGAMTSNMDHFTDASRLVQFSQKIAAYGAGLQHPRQQLATAYAVFLLEVFVYNLVFFKKYSLAQQVLIEARKTGLDIQSNLLKLRVRFPWLAYFDIKFGLKKLLRIVRVRKGDA